MPLFVCAVGCRGRGRRNARVIVLALPSRSGVCTRWVYVSIRLHARNSPLFVHPENSYEPNSLRRAIGTGTAKAGKMSSA